jgi:hypothetical protein
MLSSTMWWGVGGMVLVIVAASGCGRGDRNVRSDTASPWESDLAFLQQHTQVVVLGDPGAPQVIVAPEYQGRVMTSTTGGPDAPSYGWIGRAAIASGTRQPHINVFGGEDRFWLGPEGGQYSLYFRPGDPFDLDHWQVPEAIDWGGWDVAARSATTVGFRKHMALVNYSGTRLELGVDRTVRLLGASDITAHLGEPATGVRVVAFESINTVRNAGSARWTPESGLVSVWILGMFAPSPSTTIAIPFVAGPEERLGPVVNDAYFGRVPPDRLVIGDGIVYFRGDGQYRSKIGLSPARALSVAGSYDADARVLTLVQYTRPDGPAPYVNSMWAIQREPYKGDAINSYNDGPPEPGKPPLGPFYELETSSPALSLAPDEQHTHVHRTFHLTGDLVVLDRIARRMLGADTSAIAAGLTGDQEIRRDRR